MERIFSYSGAANRADPKPEGIVAKLIRRLRGGGIDPSVSAEWARRLDGRGEITRIEIYREDGSMQIVTGEVRNRIVERDLRADIADMVSVGRRLLDYLEDREAGR